MIRKMFTGTSVRRWLQTWRDWSPPVLISYSGYQALLNDKAQRLDSLLPERPPLSSEPSPSSGSKPTTEEFSQTLREAQDKYTKLHSLLRAAIGLSCDLSRTHLEALLLSKSINLKNLSQCSNTSSPCSSMKTLEYLIQHAEVELHSAQQNLSWLKKSLDLK